MKTYLRNNARAVKLALAAALLATVAACGGGGGGGSGSTAVGVAPDPTIVPPSAYASVSSFITYLNGLLLTDFAEPLNADAVVAPVSDTTEPTPIP